MQTRLLKLILGLLLLCGCMETEAGEVFVVKKPSGCTASYGSELATNNNAVELGGTETDATTGWSATYCTFDSINTAPYNGNYHFSGTATADLGRFYRVFSSLSGSTVYAIETWIRHSGTGDTWQCGFAYSGGLLSMSKVNVLSSETTYKQYRRYFLYNVVENAFSCREYNATNSGTVYLDAFTIKPASLCYGSELNTGNASTPGTGEVNGTSGFTAEYNAQLSSTSSGSPADGTYHILCESNTTPTEGAGCYMDLSTICTSGTKYMIRAWQKHVGTGHGWRLALSGSNTTFNDSSYTFDTDVRTSTTYTEFGISFTYSSSVRYLLMRESSSYNDGGFYLDGLSIKEITAE